VRVRPGEEAGARDACAGAMDATGFLAAHGFDVDGPVDIVLVHELSGHVTHSAIGAYLRTERRTYVLSYDAFRRLGTWFGVPADRTLYRSLVAHEVAHALAGDSFRIADPTVQAHEYIAYTTMFATMDESRRAQVLARFPGEGYEGDWQMGTTIYLLDPLRFGSQAYRHFLKPENGARYLRDILAGEVLRE